MRKINARLAAPLLATLAALTGRAQDPGTPAPTPSPLSSYPAPVLYAPLPTPTPAPSTTPISLAVPIATPTPAAISLATSPTPAPTPLPDGTMPLPLPSMPTPAPLPDASSLSDQLALPPTPTQSSEKLANPGGEKNALKSSEQTAMEQKMVMVDFEKDLTTLIAKQRNANVPDLTLNDAVQISLRQNPQVLNAIQQIRLTRGQLIQVVAQAIPQIAITSAYSQQAESLTTNGRNTAASSRSITITPEGGSPTTIALNSGSKTPQNQSWNIQFEASQLIFDGGATISGIKAGTAAYDSAFYSLRAEIDSIVSQIISQFYQVVLNRALIVAQEQNCNLLQQQVQDQQNRYDAGTVPRFNVLQAEVALANAQPPLIQAKNAYRVSLYQLVQLMGMDYPTGRPSEVPFNVVGNLGYSPQKIDTDESIRTAISRNPSLKAQRETILANAANVNVQFAGYLPKVSANGGYQIVNDPSSSDIAQYADGWFFGAVGSWNIFDGGATYGLVAQAKAQLMQSKNTYDNGVRQVVLNVQQAISNLQEAQETIESQTASVVQATEALRLSRERLDAGAGTQLDVLNAQVQLLQAQTNVLQARYNYISSMASYDLALSLDTKYVETFDDPLIHPLSPQALNSSERRHFNKVTTNQKPQPALPHVFRHSDPIQPILQKNSTTPASSKGKGKNKSSTTTTTTTSK